MNVSTGAQAASPPNHISGGFQTQEKELWVRHEAPDLPGRLNPVQLRQTDIEKNQIRL
jgi:hypothetical protein